MAFALASLAFNMASEGPFAVDASDPDAGSTDGLAFDSGFFDAPSDATTTCTNTPGQVCAPDGGPGCAGGGGLGGFGGQGGAASVALLAIGSTNVTMTNGAFVIGHGGTGGPGGGGEVGNPGMDGGMGGAVACYGSCPGCMVSSMLQPGSAGGGTNGGNGGQGGGGAGGPAYFYVLVNGATVNASTATLDASVTGTPGAGGPPNGPDGSAGIHP